MKRVRSKLTQMEFYLTDEKDPPFVKDDLPVLTDEDMVMIQSHVLELGKEGVEKVLRRKKRGISVNQSIWDFIRFERNKPGLSPAAKEFFNWVDHNLREKMDCENMEDTINKSNDHLDEEEK